MQSHLAEMAALAEADRTGDEEMMQRLEGLEAEILMSIQDINQEERGGIGASHSQTTSNPSATTSAARSHDQAVTSHDHVTTATRSHDLTGGHGTTSGSRSQDQAVKSHDQVLSAPVSTGVSQGTQFPSATDISRTPVHEDMGKSERKNAE